jgi:hypothetical protein
MAIFSRPARHLPARALQWQAGRSRSGEAGGRYLIDSAFSGKPDFAVAIYENIHDLLSNVKDYSLWFMPTLLNDTNLFKIRVVCIPGKS